MCTQAWDPTTRMCTQAWDPTTCMYARMDFKYWHEEVRDSCETFRPMSTACIGRTLNTPYHTIPYHTQQLKCTKGKPRHYKLRDSGRANFATINAQQAKAELCAACPACELALRSRKSFRVARTPQVATRCRLVPPTCGSGDCAALPPWSLCGVAPAGPTPWKMTPCGSSSEPREPARNGRMRS